MWTVSWRTKGLDLADPRLVSISRSVPRGYRGRTYPALAPSKSLFDWWKSLGKEFQNGYQWREYQRTYRHETLRPLEDRIAEVYAELGPDAILCCWEKWTPDRICHRFLDADWLWLHHPLHPDINEWTPEREAARRQVQITDAKLSLWTSSDHATSAYRPIIPRPGERRWNDGLSGPKENQAT